MRAVVLCTMQTSLNSNRRCFRASTQPGLWTRAVPLPAMPRACAGRRPAYVSPSCQTSHGSSVPAVFPSVSAVQPIASASPGISDCTANPRLPKFQRLILAVSLFAAFISVAHLFPAAASAAAGAATSAAQDTASATSGGLLSFILHLDKHISAMITNHGTTTYAILWAIVFCETGLVLTPFLPGDSLLFAAGAFAGMGRLNIGWLFAVFLTSAILGDAVNYLAGSRVGFWALEKKLIKKEYITKTEAFYDKYGGKTVVLARFVPIIRTFAPFVAGLARMEYSKFSFYNIFGAVLWSVLFTGGGYFFGNLPFVQHNFTLVVLAIVAVSVVPVLYEVIQARREAAHNSPPATSS